MYPVKPTARTVLDMPESLRLPACNRNAPRRPSAALPCPVCQARTMPPCHRVCPDAQEDCPELSSDPTTLLRGTRPAPRRPENYRKSENSEKVPLRAVATANDHSLSHDDLGASALAAEALIRAAIRAPSPSARNASILARRSIPPNSAFRETRPESLRPPSNNSIASLGEMGLIRN
jgi:hypothetical protein